MPLIDGVICKTTNGDYKNSQPNLKAIKITLYIKMDIRFSFLPRYGKN